MKLERVILIGLSLAAVGCGPSDLPESSICNQAADHVRACLGVEVVMADACDPVLAETVLEQSCDDMARLGANPKADGGFLAWMHCQFGVLHFCEVPVCEEDSNPLLEQDCANALGSSGCAQCDYYACLEDEMQCGPDGYLAGFVGKYCERFTGVTYDRMSPQGKVWMEEVRECLITRLDEGRFPGESCSELKKRGLADHQTCYLDAGICQLPLGDWLGIVATLSPHEFPFLQALGVGIPCVRDWMGFP